MKMQTDWSNLYKIRIRELDSSQTKHLVVKTILVQQLLIKYKKNRRFIRIYTEFPIKEGKICDVYLENLRTKECYAYEIQENTSPQWLEETKKIYLDWEVPFMNTNDWVLIPLKELSNDIELLTKQIKSLIL